MYQNGMEANCFAESIIGKTDYDLFPLKTADRFRKHDLEVMKTGKEISIEEPMLLPDGRVLIQLSTKRPLYNKNGMIAGVVGNTVDITYLKQAEAELLKAREIAEASSRAKTDFLHNMKHDLRTPFCGILSIAELMEKMETDPVKKENLSCIVHSAKILLKHLNEIFEFIQSEECHLPILEKLFDLHELLWDIERIMRPAAKSKQLVLDVTIHSALPRKVMGDRTRTQRILMNLVSNAIKFTHTGSVSLSAIPYFSEMKLVICFVIKDTGIGIAKECQDVVFEKFNRLNASYSSLYGGKGLGLRMVKIFLDELGGEVEIESEPGAGSVFKIGIPYRLPLLEKNEGRNDLNAKRNQSAGG